MSQVSRLLLISMVCGACSFADSITWYGPFGATDGSVKGPNQYFDIQSATLTTPSTLGGDWTLTVDTNYGRTLSGTGDNAVPDFTFDSVNFAAADFLISWNGGYYGVVLHTHNGYTSGDLVQATGFQTAQTALNDPSASPSQYNPTYNVWIGATELNSWSGTVTSTTLGNGTTSALYQITDTFQAPTDFLSSGDFSIAMSSADCANGYMTGTGNLGGGGSTGGSPTPEPGTLLLLAPALLAVGARRRLGLCK